MIYYAPLYIFINLDNDAAPSHLTLITYQAIIIMLELCASSYLIAWVDIMFSASKEPGPRLNIKTVLSTYGDFHVKDKTAVRTSYL